MWKFLLLQLIHTASLEESQQIRKLDYMTFTVLWVL